MGGLMSSTINASTASGGGIVTAADASGVLALQTAGVTALSIDATQKVTFANSLTSPTLVTPTLTSPTLTTPTINSAQVPTISGTAPLYMCRAWVNFNGTGTVAILASGNVSSITDNGVGDYTVNFTTAMPDANYSVNGLIQYNNTGGQANQNILMGINDGSGNIAAASARVAPKTGITLYDCAIVMVSIFR